MRSRRWLRRLRDDRRGAVLIEFALLAPPFFALMIACLVMGITAFAQQCIQTVAETMSRKVLTGQTQLGGTTKEQFRLQACAALPAFMDCNRLIVDMRSGSNFASINTSMPTLQYDSNGKVIDNWAFTSGNAGDIVILRILYRWPVSAGPLGFNVENTGPGQRLLMGTMVFKSESYS